MPTGTRDARAFAALVVRQLRWRLAGSAGLAVALAFAEGAGLLLLIPLLASIGLAVEEGPTSGLARGIAWTFAVLRLRPTLLTVLAVFLLVSAAHALLYRAQLLLNPTLEQRFAHALRERLYAAIVRTDWSFFTSRRTTDLVHAVTTDVDRTGTAVYQLLTLFTGMAVSTVYVAIALTLSPVLTSLVALIGVGVLWGLRRRTRRTGEMGERYAEANRRQFHMASESIAGLKIAKSFGAEHRDIAIFSGLAGARGEAYLDLLRSFARAKLGMDLSSAVLISVLLVVAVEWLGLRGAGLLLLVFVFGRVMPRVMSLQESAQMVAAGLPSFRTVMDLVETCEARADHAGTADARRTFREAVRFEAVSYRYDGAAAVVLDDVTLSIPAGQITAIVGPSGAGKSTLADLLIGLLRPAGGAIAVDGQPLADRDIAGWRRSIGYVPQDSFLLHDTVRANFRWARPGATDDEMWTALDLAAAADFLRARPEGLDTIVGDRGVRLSGGERQRLALARALLAGPALLVLDEATSALDALNEQKILAAVAGLAGRVTTVLITHRLAAVRGAHVIHVLDHGRVVESGSWGELVARGETFADLLAAQGLAGPDENDQAGGGTAASRAAISGRATAIHGQ